MSKRFRFLIVLFFVVVGGVFLSPTIRWYFVLSDEEQTLAASSRIEIQQYAQGNARAALQGLAEAVRSDADADVPAQYEYVIELARANRRALGADQPDRWTAREALASFTSEARAFEAIESYHRDYVQRLRSMRNRIIELGLDLSGGVSVTLSADADSLAERLGRTPTDDELDDAVDLAIEILRNRIDQFGVTEPQIRRQEGNLINIEIPGDDDRGRVESFLQGRGSLNFHIVNDDATEELIAWQRQNPGWNPERDSLPDFIPAGTVVRPYVQRDQYGLDQFVRYIAIYDDLEEFGLDGAYISEAQVGRDQITQQPVVNFVLDGQGANLFRRLTRDNVGNSMAIVMDRNVRAYANIREEIPTGQVRIDGGFNFDEANDLARVLRTAALPIDLRVQNQQVVGASLGEDAIQSGLQAIILGFSLVVLFMALYYKGAGLLADLILLLNLFFIMAILSVFNLTLTLTSIAGIILTVGMAVDANVIVFERIKEEYRLGKSAKASVAAGFGKALSSVLDANVTTFIAAIFLSQLGTGPIQGFAVTLAVGIVSSMFTALFVSRLAYDFATDVLGRSKLSIGWGIK
ncbi:MAG: protein translocase subunit SecD [Spirochaetaceae bacterium]|nr:MAG: protein translocase subunit SecD [Spirochaetaceae bacterium]